MKRRQRKRKNRRGFSLAETLVAVMILAILTALAGLGTTQALAQRSRSIALADAQTVCSSAAQIVADQLRYGQVSAVEGDGAILYASGTYGATMCLGLDSGGYLTAWGVTGQDAAGAVRGSSFSLLSEDAYCGLCLSRLEFTVHQSGDTVRSVDVSLAVSQPGESEELWALELSVAPINGAVFTLA